ELGLADDLIEEEGGVLDRLRERPVDRRLPVLPELALLVRDAAERGLESEAAREARRDADRAAAVARGHEREDVARHRRRRPAARSAGREREVPGRSRHAVQAVLREGWGAELGGVRLADHDRTRVAEPLDLDGVVRGDALREERRALRPREAGDR